MKAKEEASKASKSIKLSKSKGKAGNTGKTKSASSGPPPAPSKQDASKIIKPEASKIIEEWTADEQRKLEEALRKFPRTMDKKARWKAIGAAVGSKSARECINRFKEIRALAAKSKKIAKN